MAPGGYVSIKEMDVTKIMKGLYMGALQDYHGRAIGISDLDGVLSLAPDAGVRIFHPSSMQMDLHDDLQGRDLRDPTVLYSAAYWVAENVRQGRRIGIFCNEGRNRSGLLTCLTFMLLRRCDGPTALKHVKHRRRRNRSGDPTLANPSYVKFIRDLDAPQ